MTKYTDTANVKTYANMVNYLDAMRVYATNYTDINELIDAMGNAEDLRTAAVLASVMVAKFDRINTTPSVARSATKTAERRAAALWGAALRKDKNDPRREEIEDAARTADAVALEMRQYLYAFDLHTIECRANDAAAAHVSALGMVDLTPGETPLMWLAAYADTLAEQETDAQQETPAQTPSSKETAPMIDATQTPAQTPSSKETAPMIDATQTPAPVDPAQPFAAKYDAITQHDTIAHTVFEVRSVYKTSHKNADPRTIARSGIVSAPAQILAPLDLTARAIGGESVRAVFGTDNPRAIARAICDAIDNEQTKERSAAELAHYARTIGAPYVTARETSDGTVYAQKPMSVTKWAERVLCPLFGADADAYLMRRADVDGIRRAVKTAPFVLAENQTRTPFDAAAQHVNSRANRRKVRAARHNVAQQLAAARAAAAAGDAAAAAAAAAAVDAAVESIARIVPRAEFAESVTAAHAFADAAQLAAVTA